MSSFEILLIIVFLFLFVSTTFADRVREENESLQSMISENSRSHESIRTVVTNQKWVAPKPRKPTVKPTPKPAKNGDAQSKSVTKSTTVSYQTPDGSVSVGFSVTLKDGVIMAASSITQARETSGYYQDSFAQSLSKVVVGQKVSTLSLSAIGGASLTTHAFTQYIGSL